MRTNGGPAPAGNERGALNPLLSAEDVARLLGVKRRTVYSFVDAGLLPAFRVGGRLLRFRPADITAFVETGRVGGTSEW